MSIDVSGFSLVRNPLLRRWEKSGKQQFLPVLWRHSGYPVWSERFIHGPNELRLETALFPSVAEQERFIRAVIDSHAGLPRNMSVAAFTNCIPQSMGSKLRFVHTRVNRMFFGIWLVRNLDRVRRGEAQESELLAPAQGDDLLRAVAAELARRARTFPHNR